MKRLRHPIRAIREPFGTAGLVVACIALILALTGAAFAAAGLSGKQKKEVEKIAKKYAGKPGANGTNGSNGAPGAKGDTGAPGANGTNGAPGAAGQSVEVTTEPPGAHCEKGGQKLVSASGTSYVCNGKNGTNGTTGFTETLPEGKTEVGLWGTAGQPASEGRLTFPVSFPIPLASAPTEVVIVKPSEEKVNGKCPGRGGGTFPTNEGETYKPTTPMAEPGILCIYENQMANVSNGNVEEVSAPELAVLEGPELFWYTEEGASTVGAFVQVRCLEGPCTANGTWAVTAAPE